MSEPKSITCSRLVDVMGMSHDKVNRFMLLMAVSSRLPWLNRYMYGMTRVRFGPGDD